MAKKTQLLVQQFGLTWSRKLLASLIQLPTPSSTGQNSIPGRYGQENWASFPHPVFAGRLDDMHQAQQVENTEP